MTIWLRGLCLVLGLILFFGSTGLAIYGQSSLLLAAIEFVAMIAGFFLVAEGVTG